jgi:NAD(P)-dependent dehydrogenase (short-subunit alcohol dehydrogenase family)
MVRFENRVCAVTGGSSGIGRATAILFAKEGCKVVIADFDDIGAASTVQTIKADGGQAIFVHTDVTKSGDAEKMVETCVREFGGLDILANIAGIFSSGSVVDTSEEVWDRVISVNLKGLYLCSKYAIPVMVRGGGGAIVNLASISGLVAAPDEAAYDASKGAVIMLTKSILAKTISE